MDARYVPPVDLEALLDPDAKPWRGVEDAPLRLEGTPVGLQPTALIRAAWTHKKIGAIDRVSVAALHDGSVLAIRLAWSDASENRELTDTNAFPDGAAVLFPSAPSAPVQTMGAPGLPVSAWYWRADDEGRSRHVVAEGIGTTRTLDDGLVRGRGVWKGGGWQVVIARALRVQSSEPVVQLEPGQRIPFGVAIWEGSSGERAGIKAFSGDWRELALEGAPQARS